MPRSHQKAFAVSGLRTAFVWIGRSRGTGPRATVQGGGFRLDLAIARGPLGDSRSPGPRATVVRGKSALRPVGRGPVPRRACSHQKTGEARAPAGFGVDRGIARDSRHLCSGTAEMTTFRRNGPRATAATSRPAHRRARSCASPCLGRHRKRSRPLDCGRFSFGSGVREGQWTYLQRGGREDKVSA